ncbi:MAG: 2-oxoacid:acceptor oxidoreductase family protein [Desulfobacterales bacterium]|nr:2-oxoacid:acceptor oxidoreductase family protein [Desulfobacterales bacterium]
MKPFNIYLTGVGGQGIGLLSEVLLRAGDHAGLPVKGVDTHGLAQRGGIVVSRLRFGAGVYSPLIPAGEADLVVALERHEALRGVNTALKDGGTLIYYDTVWQPLEVRLKKAPPVDENTVAETCRKRDIREISVFRPDLKESLMQNIVVLAHISGESLIPGVTTAHYKTAMADLMSGAMLAKNMALFDEELEMNRGRVPGVGGQGKRKTKGSRQ